MTALSEPPQPPVDITAVPLASSSDAADCEVDTAADHVPSVAVSRAVSSLFGGDAHAAAAHALRPVAVGGRLRRAARVSGRGSVRSAGRSPDGAPPPGPPPIALLVAPTLGMLPVWATDAVATAYAPVPSRPVTRAATTPTRASLRVPTSSPATAATARPATTQRIHVNDSVEPASSTKLQPAVAATISASVPRATSDARRVHSAHAPIPISAAIPGASATV